MSAQVAADLRAAADVLERDGWTKNAFHRVVDDTVCHCASGAIAVATGAHLNVRPSGDGVNEYERDEGPEESFRRWNEAKYQLSLSIDNPVVLWNDMLIGRAEQAVEALRAAADRAEQA